jgi:hypothetical protein
MWKILFISLFFISSCSIDNGVPSVLKSELEANRIEFKELQKSGSLNSRAGYLVITHSADAVKFLNTAFDLKPVWDKKDWKKCIELINFTPIEVWSAAGRPASLKLKDGSQFEYMCVVITNDKRIYIVAEYAYG